MNIADMKTGKSDSARKLQVGRDVCLSRLLRVELDDAGLH
jgi:hypothetical protein